MAEKSGLRNQKVISFGPCYARPPDPGLENAPPWSFTVKHTDTQESVETPSHPCLVSSVPQTPSNQSAPPITLPGGSQDGFLGIRLSSHDLSTLQKVNEDIETLVFHDIIAALVSL